MQFHEETTFFIDLISRVFLPGLFKIALFKRIFERCVIFQTSTDSHPQRNRRQISLKAKTIL